MVPLDYFLLSYYFLNQTLNKSQCNDLRLDLRLLCNDLELDLRLACRDSTLHLTLVCTDLPLLTWDLILACAVLELDSRCMYLTCMY